MVTGGAGFVGSTLVDRLLAEGHSVDAVDDLSTGSLINLATARSGRGGEFTFHQLDVRSADLRELMARRRPEVVFHLAAQTDAGVSTARPLFDAEVNILGSLQVLEASRIAGVSKVVFASSGAIYGEPPSAAIPIKESQPQLPLTVGGVAKKAVGDYLLAYRDRYNLEFTALALANVYGPRQVAGGDASVVATFAGRLLGGEPCTIFGDGTQTRDFVYVDDVVDAFARAAGRGSGLLMNLGTGVETTVNDLYRVMAAAAGSDRRALNRLPGSGAPDRSCLDPSRAAIHLGWKPWTPLAEGVAATLEWHRTSAR